MRRAAFIAFASLVLATPALGVDTMSATPSAEEFAKDVAISDLFELESSQLAESKGGDETKTFATKMLADHQKTTEQLKGLVSSGKVKATLPSEMDSAHKVMLEKLNGLSGPDFDKQYNADQVTAHRQAVSLFERYSQGGSNPDLRDWATKTLPTLRHHLEMAQGLKVEPS